MYALWYGIEHHSKIELPSLTTLAAHSSSLAIETDHLESSRQNQIDEMNGKKAMSSCVEKHRMAWRNFLVHLGTAQTRTPFLNHNICLSSSIVVVKVVLTAKKSKLEQYDRDVLGKD